MSLPASPKRESDPEPPVRTSSPWPPKSNAFGKAPLDSSREMVSLPLWPNTLMVVVLATLGEPPTTLTALPLIRILPAASRLTEMLLLLASPKTESRPADGTKSAVTAGMMRSTRGSMVGANRLLLSCFRDRQTGRDCLFSMRKIQEGSIARLPKNRGTAAPPLDVGHPATVWLERAQRTPPCTEQRHC